MFNSPINNFHIGINAFIVFVILILIIINYRNKNINKNLKLLRPISVHIFMTCLFSTLALMFTSYSDIFFVISFILIDWIYYSLVLFTKRYNKEAETKNADRIFFCVLILDNIILIIGLILFKLYNFNYIINFELTFIDDYYYLSTVIPTPYFIFHILLSYIQIIISLAYLIRRMIIEPKVYRIKFTGLIVSIIFIVGINLFFLLSDQAYDYSYLLYGVHLTLLYNSLSERKQRELIGRTIRQIYQNHDNRIKEVLNTFKKGIKTEVERIDFGFHYKAKIEFEADLVIIEMKEVV